MMFKIKNKKIMSLAVAFILIIAMAFSATAKAQDSLSATNMRNATISNFLIQNISENFGISVEDLSPLIKAGMSHQEITNYLLELYPQPELRLTGEDFVRLANQTDITAIEAIKCYELAYKWHKDPVWLAELFKETGDWDVIDAAFENYTKANQKQALSQNVSKSSNFVTDIATELSREYNVDYSSVNTLVNAGATEEDVRTILFFSEIYSNSAPQEKSVAFYGGKQPIDFYVAETLQEGWQEEFPEEVDYLRQTWPVREFPSELLPLEVPQDRAKYAVEAQQMQTQTMGVQTTSLPNSVNILNRDSIVGSDVVTPFNSYFQGASESIDPKTGNILFLQQDFSLPGMYDTDFNFTRAFNGSTYLAEPVLTAVLDGYYVEKGSLFYEEEESYNGGPGYAWSSKWTFTSFTYDSQITYDGYVQGTWKIYYEYVGYFSEYDFEIINDYIGAEYDQRYKSDEIEMTPNIQYYAMVAEPQSKHSNLFGLGDGWSIAGVPTLEFIETYDLSERAWQRQMYVTIGTGETYKVNLRNHPFLERKGSTDIWVECFWDSSKQAHFYYLVDINGNRWTFDAEGIPILYTGKFGQTISFTYSQGRIATITDTVGRVIKFTHTGSSVIVDIYSSSTLAEKLETWIYNLSPTSVSGLTKLTSVQRPSGPDISYTYAEVQTPYSEVFEDQTYTSTTVLINLTSVSHPTGATSHYIYDSEGKKVIERHDIVPTSIVTEYGTTNDEKAENRSTFSYTDDSTTRTSVRSLGESGITPAVEYWEYDSNKRLVLHKITGTDAGPMRISTEEIATTYTYSVEQFAYYNSITTTTTLDGVSKSSTSTYVWDVKGNIIKETDSIDRYTTYTYDPTYNMLVEQNTYIDSKEGITIEYTLDSTNKSVVAEKGMYFSYGTVQSGNNNYPAPVADILISNVDSYIWAPTEEITSVTFEIFWKTKGWSANNDSRYKIDYRVKGTTTWIQCYDKTNDGGIIAKSGTDWVTINLPSTGYYDIRVRHLEGKELRVRSGYATGPKYIETPIYDSKFNYMTYEYSTTHPGNLVATNIYPLGMTTGTPESRVVIGYDSLWNAFACETTREVTSVDNVTTTIREFNEYDKMGRLLTSKTQELSGSQILHESQATYEYDLLGRVIKVTNPPHDSSNNTSFSTISYDDVNRQVTTVNELGNMYDPTEPATIMYLLI